MKFSVNIQYAKVNLLGEFGYHIFIIVFLANILLGKLLFLESFKAIDLEYYYSDFSENLWAYSLFLILKNVFLVTSFLENFTFLQFFEKNLSVPLSLSLCRRGYLLLMSNNNTFFLYFPLVTLHNYNRFVITLWQKISGQYLHY